MLGQCVCATVMELMGCNTPRVTMKRGGVFDVGSVCVCATVMELMSARHCASREYGHAAR
jgi:hypothetical protein